MRVVAIDWVIFAGLVVRLWVLWYLCGLFSVGCVWEYSVKRRFCCSIILVVGEMCLGKNGVWVFIFVHSFVCFRPVFCGGNCGDDTLGCGLLQWGSGG